MDSEEKTSSERHNISRSKSYQRMQPGIFETSLGTFGTWAMSHSKQCVSNEATKEEVLLALSMGRRWNWRKRFHSRDWGMRTSWCITWRRFWKVQEVSTPCREYKEIPQSQGCHDKRIGSTSQMDLKVIWGRTKLVVCNHSKPTYLVGGHNHNSKISSEKYK